MPTPHEPTTNSGARLQSRNRRTAFALLAIAAIFFAGTIATRFASGPAIGIAVLGSVVLLFLVVAIGRNLVGKR